MPGGLLPSSHSPNAKIDSQARHHRSTLRDASFRLRRTVLAVVTACIVPACNRTLLPARPSEAGTATTQPSAVPPEPAPVDQAPATPAKSSPAGADLPRASYLVTTITFDVLRVRVPQGLFSGSGKIWNHLDTDFLPAETARLLHRNGLRPGRGSLESWPPIKAILETESRVENSQSSLAITNGLPFLLELGYPRDQLVFVFRRDGTLAGAPWRTCTNLLRVEYGLSPQRPDAMLLEVMPELRPDSAAAQEPRGAERWNLAAPAPGNSLALRELAFRVEATPGQFIAIGPSPVVRELPYVVGTLMLCEERDGQKFESMYFLTPKATRTGA